MTITASTAAAAQVSGSCTGKGQADPRLAAAAVGRRQWGRRGSERWPELRYCRASGILDQTHCCGGSHVGLGGRPTLVSVCLGRFAKTRPRPPQPPNPRLHPFPTHPHPLPAVSTSAETWFVGCSFERNIVGNNGGAVLLEGGCPAGFFLNYWQAGRPARPRPPAGSCAPGPPRLLRS